jgi:hypothetical protein
MDSMRPDIRDALNEVSRDRQASSTAAAGPSKETASAGVCFRCDSFPVAGIKLRHCGRCRSVSYCSAQCAQAN